MVVFILVLAGLGIYDVLQMIAKKQKKEAVIYVTFMVLVGLFGIYYFSDPLRTSFSKLLISLIGIKE